MEKLPQMNVAGQKDLSIQVFQRVWHSGFNEVLFKLNLGEGGSIAKQKSQEPLQTNIRRERLGGCSKHNKFI